MSFVLNNSIKFHVRNNYIAYTIHRMHLNSEAQTLIPNSQSNVGYQWAQSQEIYRWVTFLLSCKDTCRLLPLNDRVVQRASYSLEGLLSRKLPEICTFTHRSGSVSIIVSAHG